VCLSGSSFGQAAFLHARFQRRDVTLVRAVIALEYAL